MRLFPYFLCVFMLMPPGARAQAVPQDRRACDVEEAALVQQMDVARATGRMLHRRQLADQLAAAQAGCATLAPVSSREASIERLQREITDLRRELDRAETELRSLKQGL